MTTSGAVTCFPPCLMAALAVRNHRRAGRCSVVYRGHFDEHRIFGQGWAHHDTGVLTEWARQPGLSLGITVGPDGNVWSASQGYRPGDPTEPDLIAQLFSPITTRLSH